MLPLDIAVFLSPGPKGRDSTGQMGIGDEGPSLFFNPSDNTGVMISELVVTSRELARLYLLEEE